MDLFDFERSLNQINFFLQKEISFRNTFCSVEDLGEECMFRSDAIKIASYNNHEKGVIESDFFLWAIEDNISYDAMRWFVEDFSEQDDREIISITKAFYKKYRIYLDESNNSVKFKLKNDFGETNVSWYDDFVLAGVVLDEGCEFDVDMLFESFKLQKNVVDAKLKNIAKFKGDEPDRLLDILKSDKVKLLLNALNSTEGMYIHWATESLWYYSLADLVDSSLKIPFLDESVKNALFNHAVEDQDFFYMLAKYNYPNIRENDVKLFCTEVIDWIDCLVPANSEEEILLECLKQGIKSSRRQGNLLFLSGNSDRVLIEDFIPIYAIRLAAFPNSTLVYDECSAVQKNIEKQAKIYCTEKIPDYSFVSSTNDKWIQLSDMVSGLTGALMAYVNTHDEVRIGTDFELLTETQHENLKLFLKLRVKSSKHNMFFDNMSRNHIQIARIKYLMELEKIEY